MKHKHADLIHAWADGAQIQCKQYDGSWYEIVNPQWQKDVEYRIKPEPKPDFVTTVHVKLCDRAVGIFNGRIREECNLLLEFDGETGKLKEAVVL